MRIEKVVVNSSPLIVLFRSNQIELLQQMFSHVVVPQHVYQEVVVDGPSDEAQNLLSDMPWISIKKVNISLKVASWNLGIGESSVFSFACDNPEYRAVVDDFAARRCARVLGIRFIGTGGLLVIAKRRGLIGSVKKRIQMLRDSGLFLSDSTIQLILSKAGEK